MKLRSTEGGAAHSRLLLALLLAGFGATLGAPESRAARALVLNGSVLFGTSSLEVQYLESKGYTVDLLPSGTNPWPTSAAGYSIYDLIVIGDNRGWIDPVDLSPAEATAFIWGPLVTGNAIIIGGRANYAEEGQTLMQAGVDFAVAQPGKLGLCVELTNVTPNVVPAGSPVPLLAGLGVGDFRVSGARGTLEHKCLDHPTMSGMNDFIMSSTQSLGDGRGAGAWTVFEHWPSDFQVFALCRDLLGYNYVSADGVAGWPFVLVRGTGLTPTPAREYAEVDWFQDCFPFNSTAGLPGTAAFDTTSAMIKTGRNTAYPDVHGIEPGARADVPGDSLVACSCDSDLRLDLVFRILPGPGNFKPTPHPRMTPGGEPNGSLLATPTDTTHVAVPGDASFWGQYLANPGTFGSPGGHHGGTRWDPNTWNSARMDTAEINLFPIEGRGNLPEINSCLWSGTYHESDPKYSVLGVEKHRCFIIDPTKPVQESNLTCSAVPAWVSGGATGYDGNPSTKEYTKIIPDGLLTPGSHVEYFLRRSHVSSPSVFTMLPDTNRVIPQATTFPEAGFCSIRLPVSDLDGHRWQEFGVLPDRWKASEYGGDGVACMLHVDVASGSGDEADWVTCADLLGATRDVKWGAHNGWHVPTLSTDPNAPSNFVRTHSGQAGSTWDLFSVQKSHYGAPNDVIDLGHTLQDAALWGAAGSIGSRYNTVFPGWAGRTSQIGPTKEMLRAYYRMLYVTSGDMDFDVFGPGYLRSQNDVDVLHDFVATPSGTPQPRGILVQGDAFATALTNAGANFPIHTQFLQSDLRALRRSSDYREVSTNSAACVDLYSSFPSGQAGEYGIEAVLRPAHDVLTKSPFAPGGLESAWYTPAGVNFPYAASVLGVASPPNYNWIDWLDAFRLRSLGNFNCTGVADRRNYMFQVLTQVFGSVCSVVPDPGTLEVKSPPAVPRIADLRILGNPAHGSRAKFEIQLPAGDRPELVVFDLAGRRVRRFAIGERAAGTHALDWDGADDDGRQCTGGVYFVRFRAPRAGVDRTRTLVMMR